MSLSLYDITVPAMIRGMSHASGVLETGRTFARQNGLSDEAVLGARLASDMMTLMGQIQRASDMAKLTVVRIGQVSNVPMADTETTFDEAQTRIAATISFLHSVPAHTFDGRYDAEIVLPLPTGRRVYSARNYVLEFALPNFFFHVTTAYDLLRSLGVPVGKRHFLGWE